MSSESTIQPRTPRKSRITRSISFEKSLLDYLKKQARRDKRSVNWLVNELIRKDTRPSA